MMKQTPILLLGLLHLPLATAFLSSSTLPAVGNKATTDHSLSKLFLGAEDLPALVSTGAVQLENLAATLPVDEIQQNVAQISPQLGIAVLAVPAYSLAKPFLRPRSKKPDQPTYPEQKPATYELLNEGPLEFGDAAFVRPLLKQTQLEYRNLRVAYDANKDGYNAKAFHGKVDGQGAAIVLAKAGGQWFGGYNPRGWASLGGSRPSIASFLFYKTMFGWQKLRCLGNGGMSCGNDLFDYGIVMGAEGLVIPLNGYGTDAKNVASRLGTYFERGPEGRTTLLSRPGVSVPLQELKVLVGVYEKGEDIPNSGGVLDLGLY